MMLLLKRICNGKIVLRVPPMKLEVRLVNSTDMISDLNGKNQYGIGFAVNKYVHNKCFNIL